MKPSVEQIESLLTLKRYERPEEGYWQDFLCEFHHRQRELAVQRSGFSGWMNRVSSMFSDLSPTKWAYGAGLAYATVTLAFILMPREAEVDRAPASNVNHQVVLPPAAPAVEQLNELDLSPSTQGTAGEQVF